jgi:hypothetical protein
MSPDGQLLVVWEEHHEVFARHRGARGTWGSVHPLGPGVQCNLQAAMDATGRMLVAWESQRVDEGEASRPATVSFIAAAPGHGFGTLRKIETVGLPGDGRAIAAPGVRLAITGSNTALPASTGFDGAHFVVRAAPLTAGHVSPRQQLSPRDRRGARRRGRRAGRTGARAVAQQCPRHRPGPGPSAAAARQRPPGRRADLRWSRGDRRRHAPGVQPAHCGDRPGHRRLDRALRRFATAQAMASVRPPTAP